MPEIIRPDARTLFYTPRDGRLDTHARQFDEALAARGVLPLEDFDRIDTLSNSRRIITLVGVGTGAPDAIIVARHFTGLGRRVALVAPVVQDFRAQPRPGYADRHLAATDKWRHDIENGRLDVVTIGPNGEEWTGVEFLDHRQPAVPDEVVIEQLVNPAAIQVIVDFAARGTTAENA